MSCSSVGVDALVQLEQILASHDISSVYTNVSGEQVGISKGTIHVFEYPKFLNSCH